MSTTKGTSEQAKGLLNFSFLLLSIYLSLDHRQPWNEAAGAALKLLQQWESPRHPRRWPAGFE
jgi:hypothetical protein